MRQLVVDHNIKVSLKLGNLCAITFLSGFFSVTFYFIAYFRHIRPGSRLRNGIKTSRFLLFVQRTMIGFQVFSLKSGLLL